MLISKRLSENEEIRNQNLTSTLISDEHFNSTNISIVTDKKLLTKNQIINVNIIFIVCVILLNTLCSSLLMKICIKASKNIHKIMFSNLLGATMFFFNTNPAGTFLLILL